MRSSDDESQTPRVEFTTTSINEKRLLPPSLDADFHNFHRSLTSVIKKTAKFVKNVSMNPDSVADYNVAE